MTIAIEEEMLRTKISKQQMESNFQLNLIRQDLSFFTGFRQCLESHFVKAKYVINYQIQFKMDICSQSFYFSLPRRNKTYVR